MNNKKIAIIGLSHLGMVTTACMSQLGYEIKAIDFNEELIEKYKNNIIDLKEPYVKLTLEANKNKISYSTGEKLNDCNYIWITIDMPLTEEGKPDENKFDSYIDKIIALSPDDSKIIVSSQVKLGTTEQILARFNKLAKNVIICYSPENLRLGESMKLFLNPDRIVIGCNYEERAHFTSLFESITKSENLLWMEIKEAELAKHAINSFLATCIVYINQLSELCEKNNLSCEQITKALKSESRIGSKLPLMAGLPFAGGTLPRDLYYLSELFGKNNLFDDLLNYNDLHRMWIMKQVLKYFGTFNNIFNKKFLIVGLSYKEGINDSRFSEATKFIEKIKQFTSSITLFDEKFDGELNFDNFDYDCVVMFNKSKIVLDKLGEITHKILVIDPNNICKGNFHANIVFRKVGEK